jgi:hypothetical protein
MYQPWTVRQTRPKEIHVRHILLFEETKTGATIAIGPFTNEDTARAWREKHEPVMNGDFIGQVPAFATARALADNKIEQS